MQHLPPFLENACRWSNPELSIPSLTPVEIWLQWYRVGHRDIPTHTTSAKTLSALETKPKNNGKNEKEKDEAEWNQAIHVLWEQFGLRAQDGFNEIISHL